MRDKAKHTKLKEGGVRAYGSSSKPISAPFPENNSAEIISNTDLRLVERVREEDGEKGRNGIAPIGNSTVSIEERLTV